MEISKNSRHKQFSLKTLCTIGKFINFETELQEKDVVGTELLLIRVDTFCLFNLQQKLSEGEFCGVFSLIIAHIFLWYNLFCVKFASFSLKNFTSVIHVVKQTSQNDLYHRKRYQTEKKAFKMMTSNSASK